MAPRHNFRFESLTAGQILAENLISLIGLCTDSVPPEPGE